MDTPRYQDVNRCLGLRLKTARLGQGLSRRQLAAAAGLSVRFLQHVEAGSGRLTVVQVLDLSRLLGLPLSYFLPGPLPDDLLRRCPVCGKD